MLVERYCGYFCFSLKRFFLTFYWNPNETIITTATEEKNAAVKKVGVVVYIIPSLNKMFLIF